MASGKQDDHPLAVLDNWEDMDEIDVLDHKFSTLIGSGGAALPNQNTDHDPTSRKPPAPTSSFTVTLTGDDALRSQYVPPEPTVKILRRPAAVRETSDNRNVQPKKSLQQREEEYAQARLRILGDTAQKTPPEDKVCSIQNKEARCESDNVIRLPKGPDGTNGFKIRR